CAQGSRRSAWSVAAAAPTSATRGRSPPRSGPAGSLLGRADRRGDRGVDGALGSVVGQRRRSATPLRAQGLEVAPVAQPALGGAPVPALGGSGDRRPQGPDLALGRRQ